MLQNLAIGIIGGYGATGKEAAFDLWKSTRDVILIGGRSAEKASRFATEFSGRASAAAVDIFDAQSLDEFCSRCSLVVNCAGPVTVLQDRVAQAALRNNCHYVDPAGMSFVVERMLPREKEISDAGLSFVVSAGWLPGLTEVLPSYANAVARNRMDSVESITVYFGDSGGWSESAVRDAVWQVRRSRLFSPQYFQNGEPRRAAMSAASRTVDLGGRIGKNRFSMFSTPEQPHFGRQLKDCKLYTYCHVPGVQAVISTIFVATCPLPEKLSIRLLGKAMRSGHLSVGGFIAAEVVGNRQGRRMILKEQIVYDHGRGYWMNGIVLATVARHVLKGSAIKPGVHFLSDAADLEFLMGELRRVGIEQTESFTPCE